MVQTLNFISLSSQQAPNDVDWPGLVKAGVQGALIRLGHGIIRDPCASGHIAKAKQYGLYWHGYHTYEGVVNEPQFTIKNATDLGLSNSQYYFVDLAKSSDPFNDYYALHATWLSQGYSTGLLISNDDYLSKFKDSEVIASGTLRWLISDTEPADYDVWQYSSEGTVGTSSVKVGFNFAKTDKLKYNLSTTLTGADISKDPYNPQAPVGGAYIGWGYDTTGLGGGKTIGYSTNGKNFYALIGPNGLVVRKSDGNRIYGTIADQIDSAISANVIPAKSAADSAVAYANDAIENSRVNSQAIDDINSAVSDAVSAAAVARSDGLRAWNAAQSNVNLIDLNYASASASISSARTEAIAAADEAKASASAAQADIVAVRSDVAIAKSDIAVTKTNLASQATNLSSYAAQASAAGKDITTLKSQAGQLEQDMADTKGDVSQLKVSASSASVALSDAAGNISSLQATASELETKYADAAGDISTLQANAKGMTQTISDAQGDIAKLKTRADGFDTQFANINGDINKIQTNATGVTQTLANTKSDVAVLQSRADGFDAKYATAAGDINTLKTNASGFSQTLTNAQGDISTLKSTVSGVQTTLTNAQGDISTLQSDVSGLKKTTSDNAGNISILQSTAQTLTSQMSGAQGDISTLKQTATSLNSKYVGMSGDLNNLKSQAQWVTVTDTVDLNNIKTPCHEFLKGTVTNAPNETAWWYLTVEGSEGNRITQTVIADQSNNRYTRRFADSWSAWVRDATQTDVTALSGQITANTTQITQNKQAIALKADQTTVDKTNGTVQQLQSQLQVQAGQIATKVSSSDLDAKGYATQTYTQTQIKQTSDNWNANLTKLQNDTKTALTNLSIGVEGVQAQVYNSDGSSKITQLSNLISTKVSSDDFNSLSKSVNLQTLDSADINNMKTNGHYFVHNLANNPIGGWVYVDVTGNGNDRIRQDVYQDSGIGHKYRRLYGTSWTNWEEGATYTEINQLQDAINLRVTKGDLISQINLQAGTALIQSNKLVLDAGTTVFTGEAFIPSAAISSISADKIMLGSSALWNTDGTLNLVNQNGNLKALIQVKQGLVQDTTQSIISFSSDYNNRAFSVTPVGATITPTLFFERYDQTAGHWLGFTRNEIRRDGLMFHTWDDEGERFFVGCHARFDRNISADGTINQGTWNGTNGKPLAGILTIATGNTIWSGSDFLAIGDHLSNSFTNVMARSFSQQSTLSSKTNIEAVDPKDALDLVNRTDIRSYQYKTDVAEGKTKRYTSLIIDDVNDVSQYYAPDEFTNEERTGRDDGSAVGYLFLAVQELTRRIKTLEEKLNG